MSQIITQIEGTQLKLSNLDKVLFPTVGITKAELIQYYMSIKEYILPYLCNRPLTLIRYPEGIEGTKFYSKNAPDFTPDWIKKSTFHDIAYITIEKLADLIYVVNLASLELHVMTQSVSQIDNPDTIIFDLDPSDGFSFEDLKTICRDICDYVSTLGYHPHIKTSGSKGLHIYLPIIPIYSREVIFATAKSLGQGFIEKHNICTLKISKENRVGKILIDIYRNHQSQTCVAPLSTRAKSNAPVSMPLMIEDLATLASPSYYTVKNAKTYLDEKNPWKNFFLMQTKIYTDRNAIPVGTLPPADHALDAYAAKRDFTLTNEPRPEPVIQGLNNRYTIQIHRASNLHYDLRLEENGVLTSWAIPKSLPSQQGIKRLAIRTEDHPIKYLDFEGTIPKEEYGGGEMWIYDTGFYEALKKDEKSYRFRLKGGKIEAEYALLNTKEDQWIVDLKSEDLKLPHTSFMLAEQIANVPQAKDYFFELKWDGIRVLIKKEGNHVEVLSKSGRNITTQFPEIAKAAVEIDAEVAILDGELVCLDKDGRPIFAQVISRMHTKSTAATQNAVSSNPAVLYTFDLLYLDNRSITQEPVERRRQWLKIILPKSESIRYSDAFDDGHSLFEAAKNMNLEGIIAKRKTSKYVSQRSKDWLKIKVKNVIDVILIGYTQGKGDRSALFGALHVATLNDDHMVYMGKVGTGFDEAKLKYIYDIVASKPTITKPIADAVDEEALSVWIADGPCCEVQYASLTPNGTLREPVFVRIKEEE